MGKKNKEKQVPVAPAEKKTSLIDKLKFMNKNQKPQEKKETAPTSIVSKRPIDISTSKATSNTVGGNLPSFFMQVQNMIVKNAHKNGSNIPETQKKDQNIIKEEKSSKNEGKSVQYETWEIEKKDQRKLENESEKIIEEKAQRYNFS